jgi:hypothetical protein
MNFGSVRATLSEHDNECPGVGSDFSEEYRLRSEAGEGTHVERIQENGLNAGPQTIQEAAKAEGDICADPVSDEGVDGVTGVSSPDDGKNEFEKSERDAELAAADVALVAPPLNPRIPLRRTPSRLCWTDGSEEREEVEQSVAQRIRSSPAAKLAVDAFQSRRPPVASKSVTRGWAILQKPLSAQLQAFNSRAFAKARLPLTEEQRGKVFHVSNVSVVPDWPNVLTHLQREKKRALATSEEHYVNRSLYCLDSSSRARGFFIKITEWPGFDGFILFLIIFNTLVLILDQPLCSCSTLGVSSRGEPGQDCAYRLLLYKAVQSGHCKSWPATREWLDIGEVFFTVVRLRLCLSF